MKILSLFIFVGMSLAGIWQTYFYKKLVKTFDKWPVVAAEVTHSVLLNMMGPDGEQIREAVIYFKYSFRGKEYKTNTPALRGYDLFPSLEYERELKDKYRKGGFYNARVHPNVPELAYLEVAPLSRASTILAPFMSIGGIFLIIAYFFGAYELFYDQIILAYENYRYS